MSPLKEEERGQQKEEKEGLPLPAGRKDARASRGREGERRYEDGEDGQEDDERFEGDPSIPGERMVQIAQSIGGEKGQAADLGIDARGNVEEVVEDVLKAGLEEDGEVDGCGDEDDSCDIEQELADKRVYEAGRCGSTVLVGDPEEDEQLGKEDVEAGVVAEDSGDADEESGEEERPGA